LKIDNFNWKNHIKHIIPCHGSARVAMGIVASFMTTDVSKLVYYGSFHSIMSCRVIF
jgi:hypothetical protein